MATQAQIDANRRNAQKSTGPLTTDGKAAMRRNALRHGLRSRTMAPTPEANAEFVQLCADLEAAWRPIDWPERIQVESMAVSYWRLAEVEAHAAVYLQTIDTEKIFPFYAQLARVQVTLERSYARAQRDLEHLQKSRAQRGIEVSQPATPTPEPPAANPPGPSSMIPTPRSQPTVVAPAVASAPDLAFPAIVNPSGNPQSPLHPVPAAPAPRVARARTASE